MRHSVSSTDEAPKSSSNILRCVSYFYLPSRCFISGDLTVISLCLMLDILHQKLWLLCERYDKEDDLSEGEGECGYIFKLQYYFDIANDGTVNK